MGSSPVQKRRLNLVRRAFNARKKPDDLVKSIEADIAEQRENLGLDHEASSQPSWHTRTAKIALAAAWLGALAVGPGGAMLVSPVPLPDRLVATTLMGGGFVRLEE